MEEIVDLQLLSQPSFFAARLGRRYLLRHYWPIIFSMPKSCAVLIARDEHEIKGFVVFTTHIYELKRALASRKWYALPYLFRLGLRSPRDIYNILALSKSKKPKKLKAYSDNHSVELFTIAVDPNSTGQKMGSKLVEKGLSIYPGCSFVVWADETNSAAIEFYKKCGFTPVGNEHFGCLNLILLSKNAADAS